MAPEKIRSLVFIGRHGKKTNPGVQHAGQADDSITPESYDRLVKRGSRWGKALNGSVSRLVFIRSGLNRTRVSVNALAEGMSHNLHIPDLSNDARLVVAPISDVPRDKAVYDEQVANPAGGNPKRIETILRGKRRKWLIKNDATFYQRTPEEALSDALPHFSKTVDYVEGQRRKGMGALAIVINHAPGVDIPRFIATKMLGEKYSAKHQIREEGGFWLEFTDKDVLFHPSPELSESPKRLCSLDEFHARLDELARTN